MSSTGRHAQKSSRKIKYDSLRKRWCGLTSWTSSCSSLWLPRKGQNNWVFNVWNRQEQEQMDFGNWEDYHLRLPHSQHCSQLRDEIQVNDCFGVRACESFREANKEVHNKESAAAEGGICTPVDLPLLILQGCRLKAETITSDFSQMKTEQKVIGSLYI